MDFDDQLFRYFGTADLTALTPAAVEAGTERMRVDSGWRRIAGDASRCGR